MDTGQHIMVSEGESVYDMARKTWAELVTGVQAAHISRKSNRVEESTSAMTCGLYLPRKQPLQGWALKVQKKGQRTTEKVKTFLLEKFNKGAKTGKWSCVPICAVVLLVVNPGIGVLPVRRWPNSSLLQLLTGTSRSG